MLAVISVALLVVSASGAPQAFQSQLLQPYLLQGSQQVPAGAQAVYLQGAAQQYNPAGRAYYFGVPQAQQYQIPSFQPVSTLQYTQPQQVQVQYKAPELRTNVINKLAPTPVHAPVPAPAPKPLVKQYAVHESQVPQWAILRQSLDDNFDGHFQYDFETENGIAQSAVGAVKQLNPQEQGQVIQGSYSYTAPDGRLITTSYTADENGFVAYGDHLPVAPEEPELPPLIAKSLAYIRSLPPQPENQQ